MFAGFGFIFTGMIVSYVLGFIYTKWINKYEDDVERLSMMGIVTVLSWIGVAMTVMGIITVIVNKMGEK